MEPRDSGPSIDGVRITLSATWVALMLTYLLGDVLRIFAGTFTAGEISGQTASEWMWVLAAGVLLLPVVMIVLSLTLPYRAIRPLSIVAASFMVLFNLVGLPYPSLFDNFLIVFGFLFNAIIVWYAWRWVRA